MNTKSITAKVSVAIACGVAAVSVAACTGGSPAKATPSRRPVANSVPKSAVAAGAAATQNYSSVTNLTPYVWTLSTTQYPIQGPFRTAPPKTVQPGQTASWSAYINNGSEDVVDTSYKFQDSTGKAHIVILTDAGNGFDGDYLTSFSYDDPGNNQYPESPDYHMAFDPDGQERHVDAIWNSPTTIKIDALKDSAAAVAAVDYELPRANASSEKWTPAPGSTPTFVWGPKTRATSLLTNFSSEPATLVQGHETSKGQSTSISEEITHSGGTNVEGIALKDAESFTSDQEWGSKDSVGIDVDTEVAPGYTGWLDKSTDDASLTGELVFTTPEGTTFDLSNVTITKGDIINTGGGGAPVGINYSPNQCLIAECPAATSTTGATASNSYPKQAPTATKSAALSAAPGQMVIIDGANDQADAIAALKNYENATDRSFTPTTDPKFDQSQWGPVTGANGEPAGSISGNAATGQKVTQRLDITHETSSSWSLGGSVEASVGFDLAGIIDEELSLKFTTNHTWESATSDSQGIWVTADPGKTVWIEASTSTATYTGNFAFTSGGVRYLVNNVTITQPASADVDALSNTSYRVMQVNSTSAGLPANTTGGLKAISQLPKLGSYINSGH